MCVTQRADAPLCMGHDTHSSQVQMLCCGYLNLLMLKSIATWTCEHTHREIESRFLMDFYLNRLTRQKPLFYLKISLKYKKYLLEFFLKTL